MPIDINKIKEKYNALQNQNSKSKLVLKLKPGTHQLRIVPYKFDKSNPLIELLFHYNIKGKSYLSPLSFGRPDPLKDFAKKLRATGNKDDFKMARLLEPTMRTFAPVIVRGEEDKGVRFWGFSKTVYEQICQIIINGGDISDPVSGRDIIVTVKSPDQSSGKSYIAPSIMPALEKSPLTESREVLEKVINGQVQITEVYKEHTYEELEKILQDWMTGNEGNEQQPAGEEAEVPEGEEEEKPAPNVKTVATTEDLTKQFKELFEGKNQ